MRALQTEFLLSKAGPVLAHNHIIKGHRFVCGFVGLFVCGFVCIPLLVASLLRSS